MTVSFKDLKYQSINQRNSSLYFDDLLVTNISNVLNFGSRFIFDLDLNTLFINDDVYEISDNFKFRNQKERISFCHILGIINDEKDSAKYKEEKSRKWEIKFRNFIKNFIKERDNNPEKMIYNLIEVKKVEPKNNQLTQAVRDLFNNIGLCRTYNRYLVPLKNNVTIPVTPNNLLGIVQDLTNVQNMSTLTLDKVLTYFNQEHDINYHFLKTNNGYYDFNQMKFFEASDEVLIINKKTPYNYREELIGTKPPKILDDFFNVTFENQAWKTKSLLQIFGYMLDDGNKFQLMPIFIGKSRAGKGACFKLLAALCDFNKSKVDIFKVDFDSKYPQGLIDANVNIIEEFTEMKNLSEVKDYLGQGGLIIGKIYGEPLLYSDLQLPKTILSCNDLTGIVNHLDTALKERFKCILEFARSIPKEKRIPDVHLKILNDPDAMDWLLTNCIYEYSLISETGNFECIKGSVELDDLFDKYENPKQHFLRKCFKYDIEAYETEKELKAFENLVSVKDVREYLFKEFDLAPRQVKSLMIKAFDLKEYSYDNKDEYEIETLYDPNMKDERKKVIRGFVKIRKLSDDE